LIVWGLFFVFSGEKPPGDLLRFSEKRLKTLSFSLLFDGEKQQKPPDRFRWRRPDA